MNILDIAPYLALALAAGTALAQIKSFFSSGEKQLQKDIATNSELISGQEKKLVEHDRRIQKVENEMTHLPDKDSVMELKIALTEMRGSFSTLSETVNSVSRTVHRIDDYMRQEGK